MKAAWPAGRRLSGPMGQPGAGLSRCGAARFGDGESTEVVETRSVGTTEMRAGVGAMSITEMGQPGGPGFGCWKRKP